MWWDFIAFPLDDPGASDTSWFPDAPKVHAVIFDVLCEILEIEAEPCQRAALHGLNHLRHPDAPSVIRNWLDRHPVLDAMLTAYAHECSRFMAP